MTPINKDLQKAQDMLVAMEQQRNNIANQLVHVQAELLAVRRELMEKASAASVVDPVKNGHAESTTN